MKNLALLFLVFNSSLFISQQVLTINLDQVKSMTSDIISEDYYPTLYSRYTDFDTSLTAKQMHLLYYGKYFQSFYDPSSSYEDREEMFELIKEKNFKKALDKGMAAFDSDPLDLKTLFGLYVCHQNLFNYTESEKYQYLYFALIGTILKSGSGRNEEEAFVVMNISDEYEIISSIGKEIKKHKMIKDSTDCFKLKKSDDKALNKIKKLYFNISIPLMKTE